MSEELIELSSYSKPQVFLHGLGLPNNEYPPFSDMICPTLPGHLDKARTGPDLREYAKAVTKVLPDRFDLIGHSLGGTVALQIAATRPKQCRSVLLLDTPIQKAPRLAKGAMIAFAKVLSQFPGPAGFAHILSRFCETERAKTIVSSSVRAMSTGGLADGVSTVLTCDSSKLLASLRIPITLVFAQKSHVTNARMIEYARALQPSASIKEIVGTHFFPYDVGAPEMDDIVHEHLMSFNLKPS